MESHYIIASQSQLSTSNGDTTFLAPSATISGGIDMRGNNGGDQTVTLYGTLFGSLDDYYGSSSGNDQIFIGPTGSVSHSWFGAVNLGGGGHTIVNAGTISSMTYAGAVMIEGRVGAHQTERNHIMNTGTISGMAIDPTRGDSAISINGLSGTTMTNSGFILSNNGHAISFASGDDIVNNSGFIQGDMQLFNGNDFLDSRLGALVGKIFSGDGNDTIYGSKGDDTVVGGAGNDSIDGFSGVDIMIGGDGDDTYFVENTDDVVNENNVTWGGMGNDTIRSSISFNLSDVAHVIGAIETLILTGTVGISGIGTGHADTIVGNVGHNTIIGEGGDDKLSGGGGNDELWGNAGNDMLLGGTNNDTLYGGDGVDSLDGGQGADTMYGGAGNDTYLFDISDDVANEAIAGSSGIDRISSLISLNLGDDVHVKGPIENLYLLGTGSISGFGNSLSNVIVGNSGRNVLDGKHGNDTLTGSAGADSYAFTTALNATTNRDTIIEFTNRTDKILLENGIFHALTQTGSLSATNFAINAAADANDYIIYNTTTGALLYDANGNGAGDAVQFATLAGVPGVTQADFLII